MELPPPLAGPPSGAQAAEGVRRRLAVTEAHHLVVNGKPVAVEADGTTPLLSVLRDHAAYSCSREIASLVGRRITTVEGLAENGKLHPLQQAFLDQQAGQCGYCLSGILISAAALLARNEAPSRTDIGAALDPHLCRCGIHNRVIAAVARAGALIRASG
jgi:nicotinate dehydrogenase subunit A